MTIQEFGPNVRWDYGGTLNLSALTSTTTPAVSTIAAVSAEDWLINRYVGVSTTYFSGAFLDWSKENFSGARTDATHSGGSQFFIDGGPELISPWVLAVTAADMSGVSWAGSGFVQWNAKTLAGMSLTKGTYTWTINNSARDTITLTIGPAPAAAVPEPSSVAFLSLMVCGVFAVKYRRRKPAP